MDEVSASGRSFEKIKIESRIPLKGQKFAGWEGRFTPASVDNTQP